MPMAPPPPALLTRTTGTPRFAESCGWMSRIAMSVGPPGAKGMTSSMGRLGYAWARAIAGTKGAAPSASANNRAMIIDALLLSRVAQGKGPWAHLLGGASERIPLGQAPPDLFPRLLRGPAQRGEVDAGDHAVAHADDPVHHDRLDVVADPALDQALHGIAHRAIAERATARQIDHDDIGAGARREPAEVVAPERAGASERGRLEHLGGRGRRQVAARHLAEIGRGPHLHDQVAGIGVGTEGEVDAGGTVARPRVERPRAPRDVHRAVRDGDTVAAHDLDVVAAAGIRQARVLRDQVAVPDGEVRAEEPERLEQLGGRQQ